MPPAPTSAPPGAPFTRPASLAALRAFPAFTAEYLELLAERDEPVTAAEADVAGPWHLEAHPKPRETPVGRSCGRAKA